MKYPALPEKRLTGSEKFHDHGELVNFSVLNFWQWSASQLAANNLRGHLAEFLVAQALGLADGQRVEWDSYDLVTESGIKVEVKSSAYLQSWDQSELSKIGFGIAETQAWDEKQGRRTTESQRNSDVYVFCLVDTKDQSQLDITDTAQWKFYVTRTSELNTKLGAQKRLSLGRLETLRHEKCSFSGIHESICSTLGVSCL